MPTFDYGERVASTMQNIEDSDQICESNKARIAEFKRDLKLDDISDARLQKLTSHLKIIAEHLGDTHFEDLDEADLKDLVEWVHDRDLAVTTQTDYKKILKQFYKWLEGEDDEYPEKVKWLNTTGPSRQATLPKDLLTREDIDALKDGCRNARDRAFIAVLYETGARIGELIDLTVGDIEDHDHGRKVVIDGKTGQRRLPLVESSPAINQWLNVHPNPVKDNPLWCQLRNANKQLTYHYIRQKMLERAGKRAAEANPDLATETDATRAGDADPEFYKPLNPHHFRHSRATFLATRFKEAQLCEWFGWVQGSTVPGKYVHLSGRDIDDAYNQLYGLQEEEETEDPKIAKCPRCEELNEYEDYFCSRCGQALRPEAAEEIEVTQQQAEELVGEVESSFEARMAKQILEDIRKNPQRYVEELE